MGQLLTGAAQALTPQNNFNATGNAGVQPQQQELVSALLAQSQGQGPNPAQNMLAENTNNNIKQNTGMIASQKGINPALAARLASENAGNINQNAAGQAATLGAQQELGSEQEAGNIYGQIGQENLGESGQNAAASAQNAAASQTAAGGLLNGLSGGLLNKGGTVEHLAFGGGAGLLSAIPGASSDVSLDPSAAPVDPNSSSTPVNSQNVSSPGGASENIARSIMQAAGIPVYQSGNTLSPGSSSKGFNAIKSSMGGSGGGFGSAGITNGAGGASGAGGALIDTAPVAILAAAKGAMIPEHLQHVAQIYHGNFQPQKQTEQLKAAGGPVPGKAKVKGDSPKNDTVKTLLSPGEVVIPRSIMSSKDPVKGAANFVAEQLRKHGKGEEKGTPEEFKEALKNAIGSRKRAA